MNKFRLSVLMGCVLLSNIVMAQTVEQGKKFLYYERYKSARETFEKVLAANPNNIDAVYWLGETMLHQKDAKDTAGAKALFQKMLTTNGSAPLLLVGMGHVELAEGKTADARQRFETAISLTKGKDVNVLNAVGYANDDTKAGDFNYALDKLNLATQTKNFNDPYTYIVMGDTYRRLIDGGDAVLSYQKALNIDPKYAAAETRIGKIYLTQNNREYFLPAFDQAVQMDPAYAPAYFELFYYWYFRDVNKAAGYLDKYIANSDQGPEVEYLKTDFLYASGKFADARTKAQSLITQYGDKVTPRMYRLVAYTSDTLGDETAAREAMATFLVKASPEDILSTDYEELGKIDSRISGHEQDAFTDFRMAIAKDTAIDNQVKYIGEAAALARKLGNRQQEADFLGVAYSIKKNPVNTDLYNWGYANYQAGNYKRADSIFCDVYEQRYPDEIYGYLWCSKTKLAEDTTMQSGIVVPAWEKLVEKAKSIDSVKYKSTIVQTYFYLAQYYNDVKKDKPTAILYLQKVIETDPTNTDAPKFLEILNRKPKTQPAAKPKTGTK